MSLAWLALLLAAPFSASAQEPPAGKALIPCPTEPEALAECLKRQLPPPPAPMPAEASDAEASEADMGVESVVVTGSRVQSPSSTITNNQEAGVDEGGIVKNRGDLLVILRRGRLFTVDTAGGDLKLVDTADAFPPGVRPDEYDDWYDEMLVSGDQVVVIGYSYGRGGTEINRFRLDPAGRLRFHDAHHLRSSDYYSSSNYAARLVGTRLIFYAPLQLDLRHGSDVPGLRRWGGGARAVFEPIPVSRRLFVPPILRDSPEAEIDTVHYLVSCDLLTAVFGCSTTGVLGPSARNVYVSNQAVYLWTTEAWSGAERRGPRAFLFRLPIDQDGQPSAIGVRGSPTDQFSFQEDARAGVLNVLVRARGDGEGMWASEVSQGDVALLRIPLRSFGNGAQEAPGRMYRSLPALPEDHYRFRNRFVGEHVVYGSGRWGQAEDGSDVSGFLSVAPVRGGTPRVFRLKQTVDRLEVLGGDGLVVGDRGQDTVFTTLNLTPGHPAAVGHQYVLARATESETRSHGFFYRPDAPDSPAGVLALPVVRPLPEPQAPAQGDNPENDQEWSEHDLPDNTAAMVFLRRRRWLPGLLRRLVRRRPPHLPGPPRLRPAWVRVGGGRRRRSRRA